MRSPGEGHRPRRWAALACRALAVWLLLVAGAAAQTTGSSAGGGDWGSSSSSSGSSGSWSSSSGGSYGGGGAATNSYEPSYGVQCLIACIFLALLALFFRGVGHVAAPQKIGVSAVQIAIDARARRFVQESLARMVAGSDTRSQDGLVKLLSGAARALLSARLAWIYAGAQRFDARPRPEAQATHARLTSDARARFQIELVREVAGETRTEATPELVPREHEGEGAVVVTLVVASFATLPAASASSPAELERLLGRIAELSARELAAFELIWSPSAENDRMSTAELEARYPELTRLAANVGRVFCAYCGGPHAAELPKCPHCGAPTS